jgi:hypothetical protein
VKVAEYSLKIQQKILQFPSLSTVATYNAFIDPLLCIAVCDGNLEIMILLNNVCCELENF